MRKLTANEMDQHPELFRVLTDGNGNLLAVTDRGEVLGTTELAWDPDVQDEAAATGQALALLVELITPELVDPTN